METIVVQGPTPIFGDFHVPGSKNAGLPLLASSLLFESITLHNLPSLSDTSTMVSVLSHMGAECRFLDERTLHVQSKDLQKLEAPYHLVRLMRASILVLGPLLARFGHVRVAMPGGCAIGARPIEQHLKGFSAMGAECIIHEGFVELQAPKGGIHGASFTFEHITVTGTENLIMAAVMAKGTSKLHNCAREPEIVNLCESLVQMGANIEGIGTSTLTIEGQKNLKKDGHVRIIPDRIQAGSYLVAGIASRGKIRALNADVASMGSLLEALKQTGAEINTGENWIEANSHGNRPHAVSVKTAEHPGFPTDMQSQICALNTVAKGTGIIEENIFENRFMHCQELRRMDADITISGHTCIVKGKETLQGATVKSTDLRSSFSLLIAGLVAQGETIIEEIHHLDRGYEAAEKHLFSMGAQIRRARL